MEVAVLLHLRSLCLGVVEVQFRELLVLEVVVVGEQGLSSLSSREVVVGLEEFFYEHQAVAGVEEVVGMEQ
ncbi:unnamed protein product [Urochloa humidicola]